MPNSPNHRFELALAGGWVSLSFFLTIAAKGATPYLILLLAIVATLYLLISRNGPVLMDLPVRLFWGSVAVLAALFAITAQAPADLLFVFNFTMFILFPALYTILARVSGARATTVIAFCALVGCLIVLAAAGVEFVVRGDGKVSDRFQLANTATLLGFLALAGLTVPGGKLRFILPLGPIFAIAATLISGSRGPVLAWPALILTGLIFFVPKRFLVVSIAGVVAAGAGGFLVLSGARSMSVVSIVAEAVTAGTVTDPTTLQRIDLYRAGWGAYLESPIVGHGWARLRASAAEHLPDTASDYVRAIPHLHSDIFNFAVTGGVVGVLAYLTILATPVISAWHSARDRQFRARLFGSLVLGFHHFFCGLANLAIGYEFRNAQFVVVAAVLLGLCRDTPLARKTG